MKYLVHDNNYYQYINDDGEHRLTVLNKDLIASGSGFALSNKELKEELEFSFFVDSLQELEEYIAEEKLNKLLSNFERIWIDREYFYEFYIYNNKNKIHEVITYEDKKFMKGVIPHSVAGLEFWYEIPFELAKELVNLKLRNDNLGEKWKR